MYYMTIVWYCIVSTFQRNKWAQRCNASLCPEAEADTVFSIASCRRNSLDQKRILLDLSQLKVTAV